MLTQQLISILGRNHRLSLIILNGPAPRMTGLDIHVLNDHDMRGKRVHQALSVFSRQSAVVQQSRETDYRSALTACLEGIDPDIVLFNHLRSAWLLPEVRLPRARTIYLAHNAEGATAHSVAEMQNFVLTRLLMRQEARKVEELERQIVRTADRVIALTQEDAERMRALDAAARTVVIPPAVALRAYEPGATSNEVLLLGSFRWLPKRMNAIWLAQEVLPRVRQQCPDAMLRIVGTEAHRLVGALQRCAGVEVHANVPSVREFYARCAVFVVPEHQAGGIKLKTLEAASFGKAIATTRAGCEGTGLQDGRSCLVADDADDLAQNIVAFLQDPSLRQRFGMNARDHVNEHFSGGAVEHAYETLLQQFVFGDGIRFIAHAPAAVLAEN